MSNSTQLIAIGAVGAALAYYFYMPTRRTDFIYDATYMHGKPLTPPPINHPGKMPQDDDPFTRALDQYAQSQKAQY